MITVEQLEHFNPASWREHSNNYKIGARSLRAQASALDAAAGGIYWTDQTGQMVSNNLRAQARHASDAAQSMQRASDILTNAIPHMESAQSTCRNALNYCKANHLQARNDGWILPDPIYLAMHPWEAPELVKIATQASSVLRGVLVQATSIDGQVANQIAAVADLSLPYVDFGPIDLSDDMIRYEAYNHSQGPEGHCALLTPLMSIGNADPEFIKKQMVWDPARQQYRVQLYDVNTGEPLPPVWVDPRQLGRTTGRANGSSEPDYLTIYQQAIMQQYPQFKSYDFNKTQMIVMGHATPESTVSQTSFNDIRQAMSSKPPAAVMVATPGANREGDQSCPVVPGHAYSVAGFDDQGRIILMNPWGSDGHVDGSNLTYPKEIHLTEEQYRQYLNGVTVSKPPF